MCGIGGFTGFEDNLALAKKANVIQRHRGPDNQSVWNDDFIALAHQRLSIIDLSESANQPFHKGNLVIVFNGEIYNYQELKLLLETEHNVEFITSSDTEVIIEMYRHYEEKCLDYFIGMFAFAIYNKSDSSVFIARDHFGIKPLFYTAIKGAFAFGSELKTLVQLPGFNKKINARSLVSSLNYLWVSGTETMFDNCFKLPAAHYLTYTKTNGIQVFKYWELDDDKSNEINDSEDLVKEEVANLIQSSVKRHMVADVPVSSFLSGGLDSSLISVMAQKWNKNLSTYTIATSSKDQRVEQMPDDEKYARLIAEEFGFDSNVIKIQSDIINDLPFIVKMLDEPIGDPAAIITYLICKQASSNGVKVLLSGMGADEIFLGYRRQNATLIGVQFKKLPGIVKFAANLIVSLLPVQIFGSGFKLARWSKRFMEFANLPINEAYMRSYSYYSKAQLRKLVKSEYWTAIENIYVEHKQIFNSKYKNDSINEMCNTDINMFMQGLNLTYTDRASMAASVEVRVPFIDKLVITRAMQIPGNLKFKNGTSKYILKKAAEDILPREIINRSKASFGAPIRSWISKDLKEMVDDLLSKENIDKRGFLNYSFVKKLIDDDRKGFEDNAYQIYQLLTLELWFREYID